MINAICDTIQWVFIVVLWWRSYAVVDKTNEMVEFCRAVQQHFREEGTGDNAKS